MRERVKDEVVQEVIDNAGCRRGSVEPLHSTGIVRLALDLQEARNEVKRLRELLGEAYVAEKKVRVSKR